MPPLIQAEPQRRAWCPVANALSHLRMIPSGPTGRALASSTLDRSAYPRPETNQPTVDSGGQWFLWMVHLRR
jgi:hypothetical protein